MQQPPGARHKPRTGKASPEASYGASTDASISPPEKERARHIAQLERLKAARMRRIAEGRCYNCNKPHNTGKIRCDNCLKLEVDSTKKRIEKRKAEHLCVRCATPLTESNHDRDNVHCKVCIKKISVRVCAAFKRRNDERKAKAI